MRRSITRFFERGERAMLRAFAGLFFGAGLFELMCAHARFVISGASQLPPDAVPMTIAGILMIMSAFIMWDPREQA